MTDSGQAEYQALRDTISQRGTARVCAVLAGLAVWGALAAGLAIAGIGGPAMLVPLIVLAGTFEINFFVHTGVERVGRYLQVFYEERPGSIGWETIAMSYGAKFPSGLDPLFGAIFGAAALLNLLLSMSIRRPEWIALSLLSHFAFGYRIVSARKLAGAQRALDLDRFRSLASK
jgi:hypothetical protein